MDEKRKGHGEDAPPLLVEKDKGGVVGVFDGMGGAGATTCKSQFGEDYTQAYVASRVVKEYAESYFDQKCGNGYSPQELQSGIVERLKREKATYPPIVKSGLRSKLVREYPTTMAVVSLCEIESETHIEGFWAGDSRCYIWTKKGLSQLSTDDLECANNPLENLRNDAPISNCISADRDFQINYKHISFPKEPIAIMCATDGCFGYFPTPMHFEQMLIKTLRAAHDENEWQKRIIAGIKEVTGDDFSLSLIGFYFGTFSEFKNWANRKVEGMKRIEHLEKKIHDLEREMQKLKEQYKRAMKEGWNEYSKEYMKYADKHVERR